jgi:hypothetical protein
MERASGGRGALEDDYDALAALTTGLLSPAERERLFALGVDLERAWNAPGVTSATRKRIIRTLIEEIVVRVEDDSLSLIIRWQGGDHTTLRCQCRFKFPQMCRSKIPQLEGCGDQPTGW